MPNHDEPPSSQLSGGPAEPAVPGRRQPGEPSRPAARPDARSTGRAQPEPGFGGGEHAPRFSARAQPEPGFDGGEHAPRFSARAQPEPESGGGEHTPRSPAHWAGHRQRVDGDPGRSAEGGAELRRAAGPLRRRPVEAVLFDFHGTLAQVEQAVDWVLAAASECGVELDRARATGLADRLLTAGRAGGPLPARVPVHLAEVWAERDLRAEAHRAAYTGLAATVPTGVTGLEEALYERVLRTEGWRQFADTAPTLRALRAAGVPVAVVSNIGFDIRPMFADWGLADLVDAWVLSYEVGRCKPDPDIFLTACTKLAVEPARTLMVGDTPADAGAVAAGCAALVLPAADPGAVNGLGAVLDLTAHDV